MAYEIENTMSSFKKAVEMGAGIETDVHLTKDNMLICFHDSAFQIGDNWCSVKNLPFSELIDLQFRDNRKIPTVEELFQTFKDRSNELRYSCDIGNKDVGIKLISLAQKFSILEKVEITDLKLRVLSNLRKFNKDIKLVLTIRQDIAKINSKTVDFENVKDLDIKAVNIKSNRATLENFKKIIDNGLKSYVWSVNRRSEMKKVLQLKYKNEIVDAVYTDYPDVLIELKNKLLGSK